MIANLGYSLGLTASFWSFNGNLTANQIRLQNGSTRSLGAGAGAGKGFFENKLNANFSAGWFVNFFNGNSNGASLTASLGSSYQVRKNQSASLSLSFLNNRSKDATVSRSFSEVFGNVAYSISF